MQVARASTRPGAPVPALALPVLITMARMPWPAEMVATDLHRRSAVAVLREDAAHRRARVEQEDGQVLAVCLAHTGFGDTILTPATGRRLAASGAVQLTAMRTRWSGKRDPRVGQMSRPGSRQMILGLGDRDARRKITATGLPTDPAQRAALSRSRVRIASARAACAKSAPALA